MTPAEDLRRKLRLIVITDEEMAKPRRVEEVVAVALEAGARAVQLRAKGATPGELLEMGAPLRQLTRRHDALFFVNDRFDVALALEADGVHLGPDDLPLGPVRAAAPPGFLIGVSTDIPGEAREARARGADYIGCGAVYPTSTKADAGEEIGVAGLDRVCRAVDIPVVGIGGITPEGAAEIARGSGAAGVAVIGAVMAAPDPAGAVRALMAPFPTA